MEEQDWDDVRRPGEFRLRDESLEEEEADWDNVHPPAVSGVPVWQVSSS